MLNFSRLLEDIVFPKKCLRCGLEGDWYCRDCRNAFVVDPALICPVCKRRVAERCCNGSRIGELYVLDHYDNFPTDKIIKQFKYGFAREIAREIFREWLEIFMVRFGTNFGDDTVIVPLPLHQRRELERGFNQAQLIAKELKEVSGWTIENQLLKRVRYNKQQAKLSGAERISNVQGIFEVNYRRLSDNWQRPLILVDDVYTTGSTMGEAAFVLKTAGFSKISGLSVAVN